MAMGLPRQQTNAMGQVAQQGRNAMGMGAVQRPPMSGSVVKRGPNQARMDPMAGQLQAAQMARNMGGGSVGAPPPPNPGLGPSEPAMNQMIGSLGGGPMGQPSGPPEPMPSGPTGDMTGMNQKLGMIPGTGMMGQGGNPNAQFNPADMGNVMANYMNQRQGGMQRPDVMPYGGGGTPLQGMNTMMGSMGGGGNSGWGNAAQGIGNAMSGMKTPGNPMMARGGMGLGPSFMGPTQPMNQQPPNQPAPMTQSRKFGGGTPWSVG